ncbi:Not1 N-terminal domain, CCR4-Not complex component-domain-containing protein [Crucibulum laeve]|uniref:General negative regulator of transcription subunit n=1 Tax=Crucibulum laeve TaxID=68775 RepID=A0A5C3MH77_9AGAR|nr:Not1 N-terminal domain, CCR4-Not complex component-domain-containing protein [Crucibulum laeve]
MAARKLQTEIDRTLKKVSEGVELFENIYEKMQTSTNQTQKEKLELDLKTQIKKLQRLRDQIKTWVASNDIKDKTQLVDNRKLIETQMEKFKACEKEMKTKAFSKEGLIAAAKLDPKEQEKEEATQWLQSQVEELQMQVEQTEAEIEGLQGTGKKRNKGGSNAGRAEELEQLNERRKWHISRLEIVLRLLNNGSLTTDRVLGLKEDVSYFVESNTDEDFDEDEGIYDELNLDEEEEKFGIAPDDDDSDDSDEASEDMPVRTPSKKHDEESVTSSKRDDSPILKKATVSLQMRKHSVDTKPPPNLNFSQQPMASILKAGLSQPLPRPAAPATLPPIRYAAAAAAAVASHPPTSSAVPPTPSQQPAVPAAVMPSSTQPILPTAPSISSSSSIPQSIAQDQLSVATSSPSLTHPSVTSPILSSAASVSQQPDGSFYSGQESPALSEAVASANKPAATSSPLQPTQAPRKDSTSSPRADSQSPSAAHVLSTETSQQPQTQPPVNGGSQPSLQAQTLPAPSRPSPLPQQLQQYAMNSNALKSPLPNASQQPLFPPGVKVPQNEQIAASSSQTLHQPQTIGAQRPPSAVQPTTSHQRAGGAFPGSLSDLVASFEHVKQKAALRMNNLDQVHKMLEGGYNNVPQPQDTEKPKYYVPRNPFQTAPYYPQTPIAALGIPGIFSQLDVETLFWVFYYLPGTYQQFLAAKELKRQSWRFHVKYLTWFQRHSEPQAITEEYEQGVYVYFDWEGSWCQRKKSDFRFEYRYLSED